MKLILSLLLLASSFAPAIIAAQQPDTVLSLRGIVNAKRMMSPASLDSTDHSGVTAQLIRNNDAIVLLRLDGRPKSQNSIIKARVLLRSNADYEIHASLPSPVNAPQINISVVSYQSTGSAVAPGALASISAQTSPINLTSAPAFLATGSRISRGPASLTTNAIEMEFKIEAAVAAPVSWSADVIIEIAAR